MGKGLFQYRAALVVVAFVAAGVGLGLRRFAAIGWDGTMLVPEVMWDVELVQTLTPTGGAVKLTTFLPDSDDRQTVVNERNQSGDLELDLRTEDGNRIARWRAAGVEGPRTVTYGYEVRADAVRYDIDPSFRLGDPAPGVDATLVQPTKVIQSTAPEIVELARALAPADRSLVTYLRAAFDRVASLRFKPFKGTTDALTALKLGEASCNGRSRLFAALLRAQGIPTRLVGGIVLSAGDTRTTHQWVEARIGGHWIPFDTTNDHFAELPGHYVTLYRGDEVLFRHTSDIGYRYSFRVKSHLVPRHQLEAWRDALGLWAVFDKLGIPLDLLKVIMMIPVGAVVVVIFRNVVGLRTFGTFLPTLIAAAARSTGLLWGLAGFAGIIFLVSIVRRLTARLDLLHSPQLAVLLTTVIGAMLFTAVLAERNGLVDLAHITLFPVALMAITAERFTIMDVEEGWRKAWETMARTLVVTFFCYVTMDSLSMQILLLGFPELLLVVIGVDIWLGRWAGMRLTEWLRFRPVLLGRKGGSP